MKVGNLVLGIEGNKREKREEDDKNDKRHIILRRQIRRKNWRKELKGIRRKIRHLTEKIHT